MSSPESEHGRDELNFAGAALLARRSQKDRAEEERWNRIYDLKYGLYFAAAAHVVTVIALTIVWLLYLRAAPSVGLLGAVAALLAGAVLWWSMWRCKESDTLQTRWSYLWLLGMVGRVLTFAALFGMATALTTRVAAGAVATLIVYVLSLWAQSRIPFDKARRTQFFVLSTLVIVPLLSGWSVASLPWPWMTNTESIRAWVDGHAGARQGRCGGRAETADRARVAVALSGGGYRAALVHAGLLAALADDCVDVDLVSSVSGGSIVGAAYALGVPPAEFARRLAAHKPGLPTMLASIRAVGFDLFWPDGSIAEIYADHYEAVFYGNTTLAHLPDAPVLLVNATDLEADAARAREVFFKGRAPNARVEGQPLDARVRIADVVAASGAFPGAFRPKVVPWTGAGDTSGDASAVKPRKFVDGGVIDNLGVEGLRRYFSIRDSGARRPQVLIISDASKYSGAANLDAQADAVGLLMRSADAVYQVHHRHLYRTYAGRDDVFGWIGTTPVRDQVGSVRYDAIDDRPGESAAQRLFTVAIPATAGVMERVFDRYPRCRGEDGDRGGAIQRRVREFSTLYELDAGEVRDAFWLGHALGRIYRSAIRCAIQRALGAACPAAPADADADLTCPSLGEVLRRAGGAARR